MPLLDRILLFDEAFESAANSQKHKGEYNPRIRTLALSWKHVQAGIADDNDNIHLGLHEFTHVLHIESERTNYIDALRFKKYHHKILLRLMEPDLRSRIDSAQFFRSYAFTNQYEFMAVLTEYFFESPIQFKQDFPQLFEYMKTTLLYKEEWL
jgi:Mlc titration factor MtfA (ptsG expression regulator)